MATPTYPGLDALGVSIRNHATPGTDQWREGEEELVRIEHAVSRYLRVFHLPVGKCVCGRSLGGLLGTFTYGIAHGEGWCVECGWPARANHYIKDEDGEDALAANLALAYAPDFVQSVEAVPVREAVA